MPRVHYIDPQGGRHEEGMLCMVEDRRGNSRPACQIVVTDGLDGFELQIADNR